jgi:hypothetical protein
MTSSNNQKEIYGAIHSGTVVQTDKSNSYLVHKGLDFTPSNPTAIISTDDPDLGNSTQFIDSKKHVQIN